MTNESVSFPFGKCRICTGKAMGVHYGTATCEGCKAFFKRWMNRDKTLACFFGGNCIITPDTRHCCKGCRFRKCKENGMSIEAIKMGRIPKVEKKAAIEELQRSRTETRISSLVKQNRARKKDEKTRESTVNQTQFQDINHSSREILDRGENEEHVLTNLNETTGNLQWSPTEQVFSDGQFFPSIVQNKSTSLPNDTNAISSDGTVTESQTEAPISYEASTSFLGHETVLMDQSLVSDQITPNCSIQSDLTQIVLHSVQPIHESGPSAIKATILPLEDSSHYPTSQNYFNTHQTSSEILSMTNLDHQDCTSNNDVSCETLAVGDFPNMPSSVSDHQSQYVDKTRMNSMLPSAKIDGTNPCIDDMTPAQDSCDDVQTGVSVLEISEPDSNSAYLRNYVRLLTNLSEHETLTNELENQFNTQDDIQCETQSDGPTSIDTSLSVSEIHVASSGGPDAVQSNIVFHDNTQMQTLYIPFFRQTSIDNDSESNVVTMESEVKKINQPLVQSDSRNMADTQPRDDTVCIQQGNSLPATDSQPLDQESSNITSPNINQCKQLTNSQQRSVLNPIRMKNLASAIFRNLYGDLDPSHQGAQTIMTDAFHDYSSNCNSIGNEQDTRDNARTANDNDLAKVDTVNDITDDMRKTLKVFHRSVDKLYIPVFLKRRLTKKHKYDKKSRKIASRSKEGVGFFLSNLFMEIKAENERIRGFALEMPGFANIHTDDQMLLLKRAFIEIHLLTTSDIQLKDESFYIADNALVLNQSALNTFVDDRMVDQINSVSELIERFELSHLEIGLLCAILLTSLDGVTAEDSNSVEALHSHYLDVFSYMVYSSNRNNKARLVVEIFFNLIPVLKDLSRNISQFMESVFLEKNAELLFQNLL
ncbi:uncharacterized protein LOC132544675 [Ylistrum balloti]|uniref:uncharacterized protein LOC132544675 n=1 Tax=Ylistrum balloti TaxID=509963 RepID=UPI002905D0D8|nr:uncharacterized protein LOC132544675 [Ylistrum balloti]